MLLKISNLLFNGEMFMPKSGQELYLDPGSTNFIIQLLIAMGVGSLFLIRTSWSKIKNFFKKDSLVEGETPDDEFPESD
jgi:hypothetical protein